MLTDACVCCAAALRLLEDGGKLAGLVMVAGPRAAHHRDMIYASPEPGHKEAMVVAVDVEDAFKAADVDGAPTLRRKPCRLSHDLLAWRARKDSAIMRVACEQSLASSSGGGTLDVVEVAGLIRKLLGFNVPEHYVQEGFQRFDVDQVPPSAARACHCLPLSNSCSHSPLEEQQHWSRCSWPKEPVLPVAVVLNVPGGGETREYALAPSSCSS